MTGRKAMIAPTRKRPASPQPCRPTRLTFRHPGTSITTKHPTQMADQARQKQLTRRSRNGCRTCRARHVKCDETPGACKRCTSTGRQCEYDAIRLPRASGAIAKAIWSQLAGVPVAAPSSRPDTNTDERRCFNSFFNHTVPLQASRFDFTEVWQRDVLQVSNAEPAAYHAIVALGVLQENVETRGMAVCKTMALHDPFIRFAFEQYGKAMALLRRRLASNDPQVRTLALLCSINFTCIELFQGNYTTARMHLRRGIQFAAQHDQYLAQHTTRQHSPPPPPTAPLHPGAALEGAVVQVFMLIDEKLAMFEKFMTLPEAQSTIDQYTPTDVTSPGSSSSSSSINMDLESIAEASFLMTTLINKMLSISMSLYN
ncbi:Zn(II)2Cys6 transcription factor domain-containing protein [Aspergillus homomorphus CBS 101889]|uniref:Zn(2)-C6 fungal-type domain-containing protein n=1 Tax=Aspergillus homomorphus (strain CBS 101889) TaxID=1450537 RepID=A0A395HSW4_ASPHC|nr:hypothetical protein BO97DRAFT_478987 [Aspergillus homomorphus CBS 101889]RAL10870.1 hypothetical protein BO97DRAFT_478987 [Aspergillus homomorphus CBS 101889]